jgi:hypothetical protein
MATANLTPAFNITDYAPASDGPVNDLAVNGPVIDGLDLSNLTIDDVLYLIFAKVRQVADDRIRQVAGEVDKSNKILSALNAAAAAVNANSNTSGSPANVTITYTDPDTGLLVQDQSLKDFFFKFNITVPTGDKDGNWKPDDWKAAGSTVGTRADSTSQTTSLQLTKLKKSGDDSQQAIDTINQWLQKTSQTKGGIIAAVGR